MRNQYVEYTSVNDLIEQLQAIKAKGHGNFPVCVDGSSPIYVQCRPYYYDGGYTVQDASRSKWHHVRSRARDTKSGRTMMRRGVEPACYDLISPPVITIDGEKTQDYED